MEAISGRKTIQEIADDHAIHPIQVSQRKRQLLDGASELFTRGKKSKDTGESQVNEAEDSSRSASCRLSWSGSKRVKAALTLVNFVSWSITTIQSSASVGNSLVGSAQIHALLPADTGAGIDTANHAQDRFSPPRGSLQRQPQEGGLPGQRKHSDQPRSSTKPHAADGFTVDLPEATHHRSKRPIGAIPLSGGPPAGHDSGPDLGDRHNLHPAAEGFPLSGGDRGSVLQERAQLETRELP